MIPWRHNTSVTESMQFHTLSSYQKILSAIEHHSPTPITHIRSISFRHKTNFCSIPKQCVLQLSSPVLARCIDSDVETQCTTPEGRLFLFLNMRITYGGRIIKQNVFPARMSSNTHRQSSNYKTSVFNFFSLVFKRS